MAALRSRRSWTSEDGAELIEFAVVLPLLMLLVLGIIDFGFLFQRYEVVTNAAREGARIAVLPDYQGPNLAENVRVRVQQYLDASGLTGAATVTALPPQAVSIGGGACITLTGVTVSYPHDFAFVGPLVRLVGGSSFGATTMTASARMRFEGVALGCP